MLRMKILDGLQESWGSLNCKLLQGFLAVLFIRHSKLIYVEFTVSII